MNYILDMVHHNPGEPPFESAFLSPAHLVDYGYNGQVFKHINCIATYAATGVDCFPAGSPESDWLDGFTPGIEREIAAAKTAGLHVFYHIDLFVLPKRLVDHFREEICDPDNGRILLDRPRTLELHRILFEELCHRFPEVDGYIIRVGETYLMDTPFHVGNGPIPRVGPGWTPDYLYRETLTGAAVEDVRWTPGQVEAYVSLLGFLRQELCEKHGKQVFFRTWDIFPDKLHASLDHYLDVTDRIEPHPKLAFSIKHTALDFWRHVKFNECLTRGKHPQIVEVQCQREYEGKGAYPNYVMHGVINGFDENRFRMGLKDIIGHPQIIGIYSWSRGGGWYGPYITKELWPDLNAFVLARFVGDPSRGEQALFDEYATKRLGLGSGDVKRFRQLCLLSSDAILKGRHCEAFDKLLGESLLPTACWMRDDRLGGMEQLRWVIETLARSGGLDAALEEKAEAVRIWEQIVRIAGTIHWPSEEDGEFVRISSEYGLRLFRIVHQGWRVMIEGFRGEDASELADALRCYDEAWADYRKLSASPLCPSLYGGSYFNLPGSPAVKGLDDSVALYKNP
jgi:hypothetical protein